MAQSAGALTDLDAPVCFDAPERRAWARDASGLMVEVDYSACNAALVGANIATPEALEATARDIAKRFAVRPHGPASGRDI
jgi:hypothetical protein